MLSYYFCWIFLLTYIYFFRQKSQGEKDNVDFICQIYKKLVVYLFIVYMENKESTWFPLVSIITPAYNSEKTIHATLLSAIQQDYPNIEHVVINDGSKDSTQEIVESMQAHNPQIRLINNPNNLWISKSRNIGMEHAAWEIFAVLDSDDLRIIKDKISKQVEFLQKNPAVGILWTNSIVKRGDRYFYKQQCLTDKDIRENSIKGTQFLHSSMVYPKEVYEKIGWYDSKVKYADDRDFQLRAGKYFEFANLPEYTVLYNSHVDNVSHRHWKRQGWESVYMSLKYCRDYPHAFSWISKKIIKSWYGSLSKGLDVISPEIKPRLKEMIYGKTEFPPELFEIPRYENNGIDR